MSELLWSFDQLARFTRYDDPEVRYWAADRLVTLFPAEAADVIAELLLDDHDSTPELVAQHLARHGKPHHIPVVLRGFRHSEGLLPGRCFDALARLGYENAPMIAETALFRRDLSEQCLAIIVAALAESAAPGAAERAHEFLLRRPELFAEPAALRAAVRLSAPQDFGEVILKWLTALHFRGIEPIESCIRVLYEELQLEDSGWCIRTGRSGRIDLPRTIKAIESGYDLDLHDAIPQRVRDEIAGRLDRGSFAEIAGTLGRLVLERAAALLPHPEDRLPDRLQSLGQAFTQPSTLQIAERLEPAMQQWLVGALLASTVKVSTYRNYLLEMHAAGDRVDALLGLAGAETSCLLSSLPEKLSAAGAAGGAAEAAIIDWCVRTLEARGPFFPKSIALETLGRLRAARLIPEIAAHLSDDNPYIYGAAERALARIGAPVLGYISATMARGGVHPDAMQSLVRLACDMGRVESLRLVLDHFDEIYETIGPEAASEAVGMLGHPDLIPSLRRWLDRSRAMVGQALLLAGAIGNLPIPEEESILKAIDDYWKGAAEGIDDGPEQDSPTGPYLM